MTRLFKIRIYKTNKAYIGFIEPRGARKPVYHRGPTKKNHSIKTLDKRKYNKILYATMRT